MQTIPERETLTVEFKSDQKGGLPDHDLVLAVVCLANAEGGAIFLGVEKDGTVTGLDPKHYDLAGLPGLVENKTVPPAHVRTERLEVSGKFVGVIRVPQARAITTTSDGRAVRRRLNHKSEPECVPFHPQDHASRLAHFGSFDFSAQIVPGLGPEALDPIERARLRRAIETNALADKTLLKLSDDELDGALDLVKLDGGKRCVTYAGLLVIGREDLMRQHIPTHEVAFSSFQRDARHSQ